MDRPARAHADATPPGGAGVVARRMEWEGLEIDWRIHDALIARAEGKPIEA